MKYKTILTTTKKRNSDNNLPDTKFELQVWNKRNIAEIKKNEIPI